MTFSDLQSKLKSLSVAGGNPPAPLVLDAALVESYDITALWDDALGASSLVIQEPRVSADGSQIVVEGKSSFLNVEGMRVKAVFEDDNQKLKFRLMASLPDDWTFGRSFPDLPQSFSFSDENYGYEESYLEALAFSKPEFVLTTHPYRDSESGAQFEKGLNFQGRLAPAGLLQGIELLTGGKDSVLVTGLVASDSETPEFCLSAQIPLRLGDSSLAKKFQNVRLKLWNSLSSEDTAARIELSLQLEIVAGKTVELYCPFRIGAPLDFLVIGARFTNLDLPNLGQIAALVGGKDLEENLPKELHSLGGLSIREVRTGVSLTGPELAYVLVSVSSTSPWTIVERIFEIDSIVATWLIESPFNSDQRRLSCDLEGRLRIGDVGLDLYAQFPDVRVSAALAEGSTIKLGALLKHFIPDIPDPEDSLIVSKLAVQIDRSSKTYQIDAQVDNIWSVPLGSTKLAIAALSLSLANTSGQTTGFLKGVMELRFPTDGAESKVTLTLTAALPDSPDGGWQFIGSTGTGQKIPIGSLIKMLSNACGAVEVPQAIEKFTIENLIVKFNTRSGNFAFSGEGKLPLIEGKPPIEAKVEIDIDQEKKTKLLSGQLIIYPPDGGPLEFVLVFGSDSKAQVFLATYHGERKLSIDSLLKQILSDPITTGVELTLKDALLAYRGDDEGSKYLFGLKIGIDLNLAELPVVGPALPQELQVSVDDLQILAATRAFRVVDVNALNSLMPAKLAKLPSGKADGGDTALKKGLNVSAKLKLGGIDKLLTLPASESTTPAESSTSAVIP